MTERLLDVRRDIWLQKPGMDWLLASAVCLFDKTTRGSDAGFRFGIELHPREG